VTWRAALRRSRGSPRSRNFRLLNPKILFTRHNNNIKCYYVIDSSEFLIRKRPARCPPVDEGNRSVILFVTVCTKDKRPVLANLPAFSLIVSSWRDATTWTVGRFVIMPDHLHLFCAPADSFYSIQSWVRFWKSVLARRWNQINDRPLWQAQMWDTQLRTGNSYDAKWDYVKSNPVRHGLVRHPEQWPFKGELNPLSWHDP
jgi:putative transposase